MSETGNGMESVTIHR